MRLGVAVVTVVVVLVSAVTPAGAARLVSSTPEDGQSFERIPEITFEFDLLLLPDGAEVSVTRLDGTAFPVETTVERTMLRGVVPVNLPSGNYEVGYSVVSADGELNEGSIRIGIDAPEQALSGGLIAVLGIFFALITYLAIVFRADKRRRPGRRRVPNDGQIDT